MRPVTYRTEEEKMSAALTRQKEAALLTPQEKLANLDARLGKDMGAFHERMKLEKLIAAQERLAR